MLLLIHGSCCDICCRILLAKVDVVTPASAAMMPVPEMAPSVTQCVGQQVPVHNGNFKYGLCGCMDGKICCQSLWWNTWCLQCIPMAQLLNRFRWSPCVTTTKMSRSQVFGIVVGLYLTFYICYATIGALYKCETTSVYGVNQYGPYEEYLYQYGLYREFSNCSSGGVTGGLLSVAGLIIAIFIIVMLVRIRIRFRDHYKIKGNCCADFCTMWCCSCCSVIQMLRQTHEEVEYSYSCCSCMTGLPNNAPEIV
jgi:Cys-rich protein (TIGR01571 family)